MGTTTRILFSLWYPSTRFPVPSLRFRVPTSSVPVSCENRELGTDNRELGTENRELGISRAGDRILEAIKAGFAAQAGTTGKLLTAREFRRGMEDCLTRVMLEQGRRHEEQGVRMEAMNRRIDENTAAILHIAEAFRGSRGDGQPGSGS